MIHPNERKHWQHTLYRVLRRTALRSPARTLATETPRDARSAGTAACVPDHIRSSIRPHHELKSREGAAPAD